MDDVKSIYQSKTFWGVVVSFICTLAALLGHNVDSELQGNMVDCAVVLGSGVASAVAIYGRFKAKKQVKISKKVPVWIALVALPVTLQACALQGLPAHDKGLAVGEELRVNYVALYQEYQHLHKELSADGVKYLEASVAPAMDAAKRAIIAYRDGMQVYARTREDSMQNEQLLRDAEQAVSSCLRLLIEAKELYQRGAK